MALLRYFTEFTYNVVLKQLLGLPPFQNLRLPGQHAHIGPMYVYCGLVGVGTTTLTPAVAHKGQLAGLCMGYMGPRWAEESIVSRDLVISEISEYGGEFV